MGRPDIDGSTRVLWSGTKRQQMVDEDPIQTSGSFSRIGPTALRRGAIMTFSLSHWFGQISLTADDLVETYRLTTSDFQYISASIFVRTSSIDLALTSSNDPAIFFGASGASIDSGVRKAPPNTEEVWVEAAYRDE